MRVLPLLPALLALASNGVAQKAPEARVDPRAVSVHPFAGQRGTTFIASVRGNGIRTATAVFGRVPFSATVESAETEPPSPGKKTQTELVRLRVEVPPDAQPGRYPIRLITRDGVSNALPVYITDQPVSAEPDGSHETPGSAVTVNSLPVIFTGRLARRGEADYYRFSVKAEETLTFEVMSGLPQIAAGGSAATVPNFDPALTIYEPSGSWFDPDRLQRLAYNDEPEFVFGSSTDARIVHRFARSGNYLLRIDAFAGQGGPDYSYQLKIQRGEIPRKPDARRGDWDERTFSRPLTGDRLNQLAGRGGKRQTERFVETYHPAADAPPFKLPAAVEGAIQKPGESHRARFILDAPRDIAIEVETSSKAPPYFNPVVRLLNGAGEEVATNLFAAKGACSGALSKSLQAKALVPLREPGTYTIEVRDATSDLAEPDFRYRVLIRPSVPHLGQIKIDADHVNLAAGEAKTLRVVFDREENYTGAVAVLAESLPPGVQAVIGADFEPDKDEPLSTGKRERYTPRTERTVVVLTAAPDAASTAEPVTARLVVRPLADGKLGDVLLTKSILVMVTTPMVTSKL
jgi:hypothetical protein